MFICINIIDGLNEGTHDTKYKENRTPGQNCLSEFDMFNETKLITSIILLPYLLSESEFFLLKYLQF